MTEKVSTMFNSKEKQIIPAIIFEASPCNDKIVVYTKYQGRIVAHDFFNNSSEAVDAMPALKKRVDDLVFQCGIINSVYN